MTFVSSMGESPPPRASKTLQQVQPGAATLRRNAAGLFGSRLGSLWDSLLGARLGVHVWEFQSYSSTKRPARPGEGPWRGAGLCSKPSQAWQLSGGMPPACPKQGVPKGSQTSPKQAGGIPSESCHAWLGLLQPWGGASPIKETNVISMLFGGRKMSYFHVVPHQVR